MTIKHHFYTHHSQEKIWNFLTQSQLIEKWLMINDFQPVLNQDFTFKTRPKHKLDFDGTVYGKVLEIIPQTKLVYSWKGGKSVENPVLDSVVTWQLSSGNGMTKISMTHSGFKPVKNFLAFTFMNMGWKKIGNRLLKNLDLTQ